MYQEIDFWRFILGGFVILLPAAFLEQKNTGWAWRYTGLILLMVIVTNYRGLQAFTNFLNREVGG